MPINSSLFKSETCEWETPIYLFEKYNGIFHFDLDVCATEQNKNVSRIIQRNKTALFKNGMVSAG